MAKRAAETADSAVHETVEFEVWYDLRDGSRRHMNAVDMEQVQGIIADIHADDKRTTELAKSVGLEAPQHQFNIVIVKTTVQREAVEL